MRDESLNVALLTSFLLHLAVVLATSLAMQRTQLRREEFFSIDLATDRQIEDSVARKPTRPSRVNTPQTTPSLNRETAKSAETKSPAPAKEEPPPVPAPAARVEGGGSDAGAGNLFGKGDVGVAPGPGTAGGGGGTAAAGLGRGSGAPGLPAQPVLRTNREAKPIQTVRAHYPPMALRMGMESDVTLKIEVDPEGKVTKAEITKSGGAGFDDEALKAVRQARFEPAQRDGKAVPAEFTYVYRFRLQR